MFESRSEFCPPIWPEQVQSNEQGAHMGRDIKRTPALQNDDGGSRQRQDGLAAKRGMNRRTLKSLTGGGAAFLALVLPAAAIATPSPMALSSGSVPMTLVGSSQLPNGQVRTNWSGASGTDVVTSPAGTTITDTGTTLTIIPPQAAAGAMSSPTGVEAASAQSWTNPPNHTYYNSTSGTHCASGNCVYAGSVQYALQENPGEWYVMQKISGTVYPASGGKACWGQAYNEFPGESGDSGPLNYSPTGNTNQGSGTTTVGFSAFGFSTSETEQRVSGVFGPIAPHGWGLPAFGSQWDGQDYGGCNSGNNGLGSIYDIHLGSGQNPYADTVIAY